MIVYWESMILEGGDLQHPKMEGVQRKQEQFTWKAVAIVCQWVATFKEAVPPPPPPLPLFSLVLRPPP